MPAGFIMSIATHFSRINAPPNRSSRASAEKYGGANRRQPRRDFAVHLHMLVYKI